MTVLQFTLKAERGRRAGTRLLDIINVGWHPTKVDGGQGKSVKAYQAVLHIIEVAYHFLVQQGEIASS